MPHYTTPDEYLAAFWTHVQKGPGCWVWIGSRFRNAPYGRVRYKGRIWSAHRLLETLLNGPVPREIDVAHTCDNKPCVRPDHLERATRTKNIKDAIARGLLPIKRGSSHHSAKLTEDQVLEMRELHAAGIPTYRLYKRFGVSYCSAKKIISRKTWAHV